MAVASSVMWRRRDVYHQQNINVKADTFVACNDMAYGSGV